MLANCAMMGIGPEEAGRLSLWAYEAMVWHWNEAHRTDSDIAPPDPAVAMAIIEKANLDPRLTH